MRINNNYLLPVTVSPLTVAPPESSLAAEAAEKSSSASTLSASSTHVWSPELQKLIALAQGQPEMRPEAVAQAKDNLAKGLYSTPSSAAQTAQAMLQSQE